MSGIRSRAAGMAVAGVAGLATAGLAGGLALAKGKPTLRTASNAKIGKTIVVDGHGLTVYELKPETSHHLLCTKADNCLAFWPPVTVASAKSKVTAAHAIKGKLGILHRNGMFQVTLAGRPLYRFQGDASKRGAANGQGIQSFGGTWHVVATSAATTTGSGTGTDTGTTSTGPTTYPGYP